MSVTFIGVDAESKQVGGSNREISGCLCAQMAPLWEHPLPALTPEIEASLREHADAECSRCHGVGIEVDEVDALYLNLANANARALLALLGFVAAPDRRPIGEVDAFGPTGPDGLFGAATVAAMRQAVMVARATFERRAEAFTRPEEVIEARTRIERDGGIARIVRSMPVRIIGLDADGLLARLVLFAAFVERAVEAGAVEIAWG